MQGYVPILGSGSRRAQRIAGTITVPAIDGDGYEIPEFRFPNFLAHGVIG